MESSVKKFKAIKVLPLLEVPYRVCRTQDWVLVGFWNMDILFKLLMVVWRWLHQLSVMNHQWWWGIAQMLNTTESQGSYHLICRIIKVQCRKDLQLDIAATSASSVRFRVANMLFPLAQIHDNFSHSCILWSCSGGWDGIGAVVSPDERSSYWGIATNTQMKDHRNSLKSWLVLFIAATCFFNLAIQNLHSKIDELPFQG